MVSFQPIKPLLHTGTNPASRWFSYIGLCMGVLLLLCSIQMYINVQQLLTKNAVSKGGYDFISITKKVTNATMGQPEKNLFSEQEIAEIKKLPFVEDAAPLMANEFRAQLDAGGLLRTDLFLESLDDTFIDTLPPSFRWEEGQTFVPVIVSAEFLEAYNVFAPGQGLPQISNETAMGVPVKITCSGKGQQFDFRGNIVAFSDRINSVLVPKNFLLWANQTFGELKQAGAARVFIKLKDANNPEFLKFIDAKNYNLNKDKTRFGRTRQTLQGIFSALALFGLMVVVLALLLFSFYLQLVIARSKDNLQLLLLLGYSPRWLGTKVSSRFIPVYVLIIASAVALTQVIQWAFHRYAMYSRPELRTLLHWSVFVTAFALMVIAAITNHRLVKGLLKKLS